MRTRRALSRTCLISGILIALLLPASPALSQPQVDAALDAETVSTGDPFVLSVIVSWQGGPEQFIIAPPQPELPEAVEQLSSSFSSSGSRSGQRMRYSFVLRAAQDGEYAIKPVAVKYWARGEAQESTVSGPEVSFRAARFAWARDTSALLIAGAALIAAAATAAAFFLIRRRRRKSKAAPPGSSPELKIPLLLQACKTSKISGRYAGFYEAAIELWRLLPGLDGAQADRLADALEKIRFGGLQPPAEEVDRLMRQLEKAAEKCTQPGPQDPELQKYCR